MVRNVSSSGEALSITELLDHGEDYATIPENATLDNAIQKGDDYVVSLVDPFCLATDTSTNGNSLSEKLEHDETTPISEDGPLAEAVEDAVLGAIEPDMEMAVPNSDFPRGGKASSAFSAYCAAADQKLPGLYTSTAPWAEAMDRMTATQRRGGERAGTVPGGMSSAHVLRPP
ncbi:hypothetical protein QTP88_016611 [Uroleucon formosanum]